MPNALDRYYKQEYVKDNKDYRNPNETKYFNKFTGKEDTIGTEPYFVPKKEPKNALDQYYEENEPKEGWGKWALRTAGSIGTGVASALTWPLDVANLVGAGLAYDPNAIEELRFASERAGIPFNEEEYFQAVQNISSKMPTAYNIAGQIEQTTGLPLTPKTGLQKFANFAATAGTLAPKGNTFIGMNTSLPRPILGTGVAGAAEVGKALGVPEPIADIASFGILKTPTAGAGSVNIGGKTKPSGLPERGFESIKKERTVSQNKINQINKKIKSDFKEISDNIIADSEIGATRKELLNNPSYKNETTELFKEADNIASNIKKTISKEAHSKEIANIAKQESSGYRKNEYQREYEKFMLEAQKAIESKNLSASSLLEQYRNNNQELTGYFESGKSKNFNYAKRDALLGENRAIAEVFEKYYPESNLSTIFKEGNDRWTKIKNLEMVEDFTSELFKESVNYKKINDFFNKNGYDRSFKRALGEKGYKQFEQLMKDMLQGEQGYKMLNVAKEKGFNDLAKTGMYYFLHPKIALTKGTFDLTKFTIKTLFNTMLDTPKLSFTYRKAVQDLKAGKFKEAEAGFKTLNESIKPSEITTSTQAKSTPKIQEPIEVKAEPVKSLSKKEKRAEVDKLFGNPKPKEKVKPKVKEDLEFRDRFNNAPKGNDQRSYDADKLKKAEIQSYFEKAKLNYELSEKDLVNETLKLKKELNNTKGVTSAIKEKKQDLRDAIELNQGIYKDKVSKRNKLEASLEEKTKASVNKFTSKDLKKQKDYILNAIDEALAKPTNKEFVEIKVPDDGTFKVYNIEDILKQFQKKVKKDYPLKQIKSKL
jgi:hypothetical protein